MRCGRAPAVINSRCRACDHIYKREQREREAKAQGREIKQYVPQEVLRLQAAMATIECKADRLRGEWAADYLRPFRGLSLEDRAANQRAHYTRHRVDEIKRSARYKAANPDRKHAHDVVRMERLASQSDGSVVRGAIAQMKRRATHCAYCGDRLMRKHTDHMIPLALGGEHSLRNIVIVCPDCNQHKHALSYEQWIERVDPRHRSRVEGLYQARYGALRQAA